MINWIGLTLSASCWILIITSCLNEWSIRKSMKRIETANAEIAKNCARIEFLRTEVDTEARLELLEEIWTESDDE